MKSWLCSEIILVTTITLSQAVSVIMGAEFKDEGTSGSESVEASVYFVPAAGSSLDGETKIYNGITFVTIPGGTFQMGNIQNDNQYTREEPTHDVSISGFEMSIYEVTQEQYQSVTGSNPSGDYGVGADYPVYNVSWFDAMKFCNKMSDAADLDRCYDDSTWTCDFGANGFRLPTEAEWEYACRAGTETNFHTGNDLSSDSRTSTDLDRAGWYWINWGDANRKTHTAGEKEPNAWGLYDMHGNVWEWCNDWYDKDYYDSSPSADPTGPTSGSYPVTRGGGWDNIARECRSSIRDRRHPSGTYYYLGFRVVRRP